jgi:hypothetical protein
MLGNKNQSSQNEEIISYEKFISNNEVKTQKDNGCEENEEKVAKTIPKTLKTKLGNPHKKKKNKKQKNHSIKLLGNKRKSDSKEQSQKKNNQSKENFESDKGHQANSLKKRDPPILSEKTLLASENDQNKDFTKILPNNQYEKEENDKNKRKNSDNQKKLMKIKPKKRRRKNLFHMK